MATKLPYHKAFGFVVATRIASIFSVVGSSIIVATFIAFPFFRKPINRLVFYATLGNILTNVATLMSNSVLPAPGEPASGLCEFQGLLIQWFMVADSFWVLCMALNVFLVFFYGYGVQQLRHLEKWYFAFNYGIPCIPVIAYVVLSRTGHPVIGSAMLWCWVSVDVEWMRIAFFYVPAWVTILAAITIYSVTGYRIWQKQVELRYFSRDSNQFVTVRDPSDERESAGDVLSGRNNIVVTTRIECDTQQQSDVFRSVSPDPDCISINSFSSTQRLSSIRRPDVLVSGPLHDTSPIRISRLLEDVEAQLNFHHTPPSRSSYRATIIATSPPPEPKTVPPTAISKPRPPAKRTPEGHAAAMTYFYVAFLMFLALFVVWLPSSINRMYQFTHKDRPSFALNILSATVLPLQGAWNAIIYIFTTRAECRRARSMIVEKITGRYAQYQPWREVSVKEMMTSSQATRESAVDVELSDILGHNRQARQIKSPKNDHMKDDDRCSKQISR